MFGHFGSLQAIVITVLYKNEHFYNIHFWFMEAYGDRIKLGCMLVDNQI